MICALDQLNGWVDTVACSTCGGKAAIAYFNDQADMMDANGKKIVPSQTFNYKVICDNKAGTHKIVMT